MQGRKKGMKGEICGSKTGKRHTCGPWHCTSTFGAQLLPCGRAGSLHPERASAFGRRLLCTASPSQLAQTRPEPARRTLPAMAQSRAAQPPPQRGSASGPASPHSSPQARSWIKRAPPGRTARRRLRSHRTGRGLWPQVPSGWPGACGLSPGPRWPIQTQNQPSSFQKPKHPLCKASTCPPEVQPSRPEGPAAT